MSALGMPHHVSPPLPPADRGRDFGRAQVEAVRNTVAFYERLFGEDMGLERAETLRKGAEIARYLERSYPAAAEEIEGIAHGAGFDAELLFAINARTELMSGGAYAAGVQRGRRIVMGECTTIGLLPEASADGSCVLAQNWDFHPDLAASRILWTVCEEDRWLCTLTEAGILAKIGLNSDRLGVCVNFLVSGADRGLGGTPMHVLARQLLATAGDLSEALRLIVAGAPAVSMCFTLGLAQGEEAAIVSVEAAPDEIAHVWPNDDGVLVHANHFLNRRRQDDGFLGPTGGHGTLVRQWQVERCTRTPPLATADLARIFGSAFNAPQAVARSHRPDDPWLQRSETLASVVMDLTHLRMAVTPGAPTESRYEEVPLPTAAS
jgi:isopenicillin-N N-acyltransferase-like protein